MIPAVAHDAALWLAEVLGDGMEPTLRRRDFTVCRTVESYEGEGIYLLCCGPVERFYRVDALADRVVGKLGVRLMLDNGLYPGSSRSVSLSQFEAEVRGKVVADLRVREPSFLNGLVDRRRHFQAAAA